MRQERRLDAPTLMSYLVLLLGVVSLLSALSPAMHDRVRLLLELTPAPGPAIATALTASIGVILLLLAPALRRRKQRAWAVATALSALVVVTHLLKGLDVEEALLSAAVLTCLLYTRKDFTAEPDPRKSRTAGLVLVAGTVLAVAAGWVLLTIHPNAQAAGTGALQRLEQSALGVVGISGPVQFLDPDSAEDSGTALVVLGLAVVVSAMGIALSSYRPIRLRSRTDERRLRGLVAQYGGGDSLSYFGLRDDRAATFPTGVPAAVTFRTVGSVAIAAGDPIGDPACWPAAIAHWLELVRRGGWTPAVLGASRAGADAYRHAGLAVLTLGDEAILDSQSFTLDGRRMRTVRQAVSRVERAGYLIRCDRTSTLDDRELQDAAAASAAWRGSDVERGYSMALGRFGAVADGDCLLVRAYDRGGTLRALCHFVPWGQDGVSLDLMRRAPDAVNGAVEAMIVTVLLRSPELDVTQVSLNFVVLRSVLEAGADPGATRSTRLLNDLLLRASRHWQIESLYRACAKYHPTWVTRYLCYPSTLDLPRVAVAILRAESFLPGAAALLRRRPARARRVPRAASPSRPASVARRPRNQ